MNVSSAYHALNRLNSIESIVQEMPDYLEQEISIAAFEACIIETKAGWRRIGLLPLKKFYELVGAA